MVCIKFRKSSQIVEIEAVGLYVKKDIGFFSLKQGRKRPYIFIKSDKRGTFGERKRKREGVRDGNMIHQWTIDLIGEGLG